MSEDKSEANDSPLTTKIRQEIRALIDAFNAEEEKISGIYLSLCRLAKKYRIGPKKYYAILMEEGMAKSRASDIGAVLGCKSELANFLAGQPWRHTLDAVRKRSRLKSFPAHATAEDLWRAELAGLMHRAGITRFQWEGHEFVLRAASVPVEGGVA